MRKYLTQKFFLIALITVIAGCSTIDVFNQRAYEQAVNIKVEAVSLMDNASESFGNYEEQVNRLKVEAEKAYEYAKGRPQNEESTKQWAIMVDPGENMLFGFLKRWKEEDKLGRAFIDASKKLISDGFDAIIELESGKRKQ